MEGGGADGDPRFCDGELISLTRPCGTALRIPSPRKETALAPTDRPLFESVIDMKFATQAEALFVSCLQPSDQPTLDRALVAIDRSLQTRGVSGCAEVVAAEYGAHPDEAARRMRWALALVVGRSTAIAS
jgi:hypothetical protein